MAKRNRPRSKSSKGRPQGSPELGLVSKLLTDLSGTIGDDKGNDVDSIDFQLRNKVAAARASLKAKFLDNPSRYLSDGKLNYGAIRDDFESELKTIGLKLQNPDDEVSVPKPDPAAGQEVLTTKRLSRRKKPSASISAKKKVAGVSTVKDVEAKHNYNKSRFGAAWDYVKLPTPTPKFVVVSTDYGYFKIDVDDWIRLSRSAAKKGKLPIQPNGALAGAQRLNKLPPGLDDAQVIDVEGWIKKRWEAEALRWSNPKVTSK